jgi:hypothetical protein
MKFIERRFPTNAEIDRSQKPRVVTIFCEFHHDDKSVKALLEMLYATDDTNPVVVI